MKLRKLVLAPAYKAVSDQLTREVLEGRLRPGDALPTEAALAEALGVSRSTLREGIRNLEAEGLVRREGGKRVFVCRPRLADLAPRTTRALVLQQVTFRELWEVAKTVEPLAAHLAACHASAAEIERMEENWSATAEVVAKQQSFTALDVEFQELIASASGNRVLLLAREPIALLLYPALEPLVPHLPQAGPWMLQTHRHLLDAIRSHDAAGAELWMRRHLEDFRRAYEITGASMDVPIGTDPFAPPPEL